MDGGRDGEGEREGGGRLRRRDGRREVEMEGGCVLDTALTCGCGRG